MITAWICRDANGSLWLYSDEPWKGALSWKVDVDCGVWIEALDSTEFPEVKWEDENATKVELEIHLKR